LFSKCLLYLQKWLKILNLTVCGIEYDKKPDPDRF
jgi:hypothetical protein